MKYTRNVLKNLHKSKTDFLDVGQTIVDNYGFYSDFFLTFRVDLREIEDAISNIIRFQENNWKLGNPEEIS